MIARDIGRKLFEARAERRGQSEDDLPEDSSFRELAHEAIREHVERLKKTELEQEMERGYRSEAEQSSLDPSWQAVRNCEPLPHQSACTTMKQGGDLMASLQIRDLPSDIYETLSHRAEREGRSLAQQAIVELRKVPELEARQRRMETIEDLRNRLAVSQSGSTFRPPEALIREDRDR